MFLQELMQFLTLVEEDQTSETQEEIDRLYSCLDRDESSSSGSDTEKPKPKRKPQVSYLNNVCVVFMRNHV